MSSVRYPGADHRGCVLDHPEDDGEPEVPRGTARNGLRASDQKASNSGAGSKSATVYRRQHTPLPWFTPRRKDPLRW
jgi:hypothetical protein